VSKTVEFLSFTEVMGILLVFFSMFGVGLTAMVAILFYSKKDTPIVKANNFLQQEGHPHSKGQQLRAELPATFLIDSVFSLFTYFHWSAH